jgi:AcrR family transcriptional regulator
MTHIANAAPGREYRSELRARQAEETRARILDATSRVMTSGLAYVSIPAIAREAGVSIPTIYRHFGTKRGLLSAVYPHAVRRAGLDKLQLPGSIGELRAGMRAYFDRLESFDDLARAAMASPSSHEVRALNMPDRLAMFRRVADSIVPTPSEVDRDRISRLLVVLTASSSVRLWRDQLGASVDEAADDVDWVIDAVIASTKPRTGS